MDEDEVLDGEVNPLKPSKSETSSKTSGSASETPLVKELNRFKETEKKWRSILVPEDLLVAALQKSLLRSRQQVSPAASYQAVRDVLGELFTLIRKSDDISLEENLKKILKGSDGSGGEERTLPMPNP